MLFAATLSVFVALTRSKFETLDAADQRARAQAALETELDRVRVEGPGGLPAGEADRDGFRLIRAFAPAARLPAVAGELAVRALRVEGAPSHQLFEARVTVRWETRPGDPTSATRLVASAVVLLGEEAPR
jgi:hypothetical protein